MTNHPHETSVSVYQTRQERLYQALRASGLPALALNPGPSLVYLTGLHFHLSERPVIALFTPDHPIQLALPVLEQAKLYQLPYPIQAHPYGEEPSKWAASFSAAIHQAGLDAMQIGVEPIRMRLLEYDLLRQAAPQANFASAAALVSGLRVIKDSTEIMAMRKAAQIAQQALLTTLPMIRVGMTEHELAAELTLQLMRGGSDAENAFAPIVSGGPNSANPHAVPSTRPLQPGDLLVIDFGASYQGYLSDITRTFAIGELEPECTRIAELVLQANTAGRNAARAGITAHAIDQAARTVIDSAGYGAFFTHRTGHGLGMESHEEPYIRQDNPLILQPGMTFTIEPGIYLPNRNGVRIEDDVLITPTGLESLTDLPREVTRLI